MLSAGRVRATLEKLTNLHERLITHWAVVLRIVYAPRLSFMDNLGEQGMRVAKVQQAIGRHMRTRSHVSSLIQRHGHVPTHSIVTSSWRVDGYA